MEKSGFAQESNVPSTCARRTCTEVPQAGGSHLSLRLTFEEVTANSVTLYSWGRGAKGFPGK